MAFGMKIVGLTALNETFKTISKPKPIYVTAKADHSAFIEYGTVNMGAQPFARPGTAKALAAFNEIEGSSASFSILLVLLAERMAKEWKKLAPVDTGELRDSIVVEK